MYRFCNGKIIKLSNSENEESCKKINPIYDENGFLLADKRDICDCTTTDCPGCFFPCEKCGSSKCGHLCRVNRSWSYKKSVNSTSSNPNNNIMKIIDTETDDNLVKQESANLKPVDQPINDFENMDVSLECNINADDKIENVEKINLKIIEMQNDQIKSVDPVQNNFVINNIENKEEIINVNNELLTEKEKLIVVQKNTDEIIITEKQPTKIVEENDKKNLQQTDNEKVEKVINHEKQTSDEEPMKELKNANIEQTVLLSPTNNEELITNELKELQDTEFLQQTENTENTSIKNNKLALSEGLKNTSIEKPIFRKPTNNLENNNDSKKYVNTLIDSEKNNQIKTTKIDIENKLTDLKQIENENIEKTISHDEQINKENVQNVVNDKLMEIEEIISENAFKQTVNTENTSVEINPLTEQKEFRDTINVGMGINQLIELEEIKSKDTDESIMEPENIKNIEEFKVKDDEL